MSQLTVIAGTVTLIVLCLVTADAGRPPTRYHGVFERHFPLRTRIHKGLYPFREVTAKRKIPLRTETAKRKIPPKTETAKRQILHEMETAKRQILHETEAAKRQIPLKREDVKRKVPLKTDAAKRQIQLKTEQTIKHQIPSKTERETSPNSGKRQVPLLKYLSERATRKDSRAIPPPVNKPRGATGKILDGGKQALQSRSIGDTQDCATPRCVDSVPDENGICEVCPNGRNCWLTRTGGDIISDGVIVVESMGSDCSATCRCPWTPVYEIQGSDTRAACALQCTGSSWTPEEVEEWWPEGLPFGKRKLPFDKR